MGRSGDEVAPAMITEPAASIASPEMYSCPDPPKYVEASNEEPSGVSFATNPSFHPPANADWKGLFMGKSADSVLPAIQTLPAESRATRPPTSHWLPPIVVEKSSAEPVLLNFAR